MTDEITHIDEMRDRIPSHMRAGTNFDKLLQIFAERYQGIEQTLQDMLTMRAIDTATGAKLDGIGQIVDLAREAGQTDTSYRFAIKSRFILLTKSGSVEEVIETYKKLIQATDVDYTELYPATFQVVALPGVDVADPDVAAFINATMQGIKPAGVNMILGTAVGFNFSDAYEADGSGNGPSDIDEGFGSSTYGDDGGGGFARAI